jgi:hypothetical protein
MKKTIISLIFIVFGSALVAFAQDDKPLQTRIRVNNDCTVSAQCFALEIYMPSSIRTLEKQELQNNRRIAQQLIVLSDKKKLFFDAQLSPRDILLATERQGRIFSIYLPQDFPLAKGIQVGFLIYPTDNGNLTFLPETAETDYISSFIFDGYNKLFRQKITFSEKPFGCDDDDIECNKDIQRLQASHEVYMTNRIQSMTNFFSTVGKKNIEFRIEDYNKCLKVTDSNGKTRGCLTDADFEEKLKTLKTLADFPATPEGIKAFQKYFIEESEKFKKERELGLKDLPLNPISKVDLITPNPSPKSFIVRNKLVLVDFYTEKILPGKFSAQLSYTAAKVPIEVGNNLTVVGEEISQLAVNPAVDTGKVGERDLPDKLDVAILFGSSVEEKEKVVSGVTTKVRERVTRATLDLRFQPFKPEPVIGSNKFIEWTPIYLDAKVSTGKIDSDTLSLNRVVLGTKFDFTKFYKFKKPAYATNPDYLNLNAQFVQASDRDFRQLEYKGVFEFLPRLAFLNRIPANFTSIVNKVIKPPGKSIPFREVSPSRGYKIQPVVGGEIGKTWFRRRPASAIEATDYIRRLYVGFDAMFYLSQSTSLNFSDKYYFSFGKGVDKKENYFKATLDFGLRKRNNFGDSFFISFEKGNTPPFNTPDVNAFKVGYRFVNPTFTLF